MLIIEIKIFALWKFQGVLREKFRGYENSLWPERFEKSVWWMCSQLVDGLISSLFSFSFYSSPGGVDPAHLTPHRAAVRKVIR